MPLSNMMNGTAAAMPAPELLKGIFYVTTDTEEVFVSDGDEWIPTGGAAPLPPELGFRVALAIGIPYVNTFAALNAGNQPALLGGQLQLAIPSQTVDMAVTIFASFPAPYIQRAGYLNQLRLKEQLIIQDTGGFTTVGGLPVYDAETREQSAYPAVPGENPNLDTYMRGHGFQGQYHTFELPAGNATTLQFDVNWILEDDGTQDTYGVVDGLDNPARRISATGVPIP